VHELSSSFILAYHGCDRSVAERLLNNRPFRISENEYDWLGSGVYFWESNPARALHWARHLKKVARKGSGKIKQPYASPYRANLTSFCRSLAISRERGMKASTTPLAAASANVFAPWWKCFFDERNTAKIHEIRGYRTPRTAETAPVVTPFTPGLSLDSQGDRRVASLTEP